MSENLRKRLEAKRQEEITKAANRLLTDPDVDTKENNSRVEAYSKLLAAIKPRPSRERAWAVIVAAICLSVAGLLWSLRVDKTRVTLKIRSEAVTMKLAEPWSWSGNLSLGTDLVRIERLTSVDALVLGRYADSLGSDAWIQIQGGKVSLAQLGLEKNGVLTIETLDRDNLDLYAHGAEFWGQFMVLGSAHLSAGKEMTDTRIDRRLDLRIPETITFRAESRGAVPAMFKARPGESWVLRGLLVQDLRFSQELPAGPGEVSFVSAIQEGILTLHDVSRTINLYEKDRLSLTGVEGRVVELQAGESFSLIFEGLVETAKIGPENYTQNLAPTYLEYFYHQKTLAFFWSVVVFLWGILWSIRRVIFPRARDSGFSS